MQITATKCDGCGTVREGYATSDWLTVELNKMPTTEHKAHFCPVCAPLAVQALFDRFSESIEVKPQTRLWLLPGVSTNGVADDA